MISDMHYSKLSNQVKMAANVRALPLKNAKNRCQVETVQTKGLNAIGLRKRV